MMSVLPISLPVRVVPLDPVREPAFAWEIVGARGELFAWFMDRGDAQRVRDLVNASPLFAVGLSAPMSDSSRSSPTASTPVSPSSSGKSPG
jgi:hypothetical protein